MIKWIHLISVVIHYEITTCSQPNSYWIVWIKVNGSIPSLDTIFLTFCWFFLLNRPTHIKKQMRPRFHFFQSDRWFGPVFKTWCEEGIWSASNLLDTCPWTCKYAGRDTMRGEDHALHDCDGVHNVCFEKPQTHIPTSQNKRNNMLHIFSRGISYYEIENCINNFSMILWIICGYIMETNRYMFFSLNYVF